MFLAAIFNFYTTMITSDLYDQGSGGQRLNRRQTQAYHSGRGYGYGERPSNNGYRQRGMDYDDYTDDYQGKNFFQFT